MFMSPFRPQNPSGGYLNIVREVFASHLAAAHSESIRGLGPQPTEYKANTFPKQSNARKKGKKQNQRRADCKQRQSRFLNRLHAEPKFHDGNKGECEQYQCPDLPADG